VLCWHLIIKGEDYAFAQPSLVAHKRRKLQLRAGHTCARGRKGTASGYSLKAVRTAERRMSRSSLIFGGGHDRQAAITGSF
jgi:transposase